MIKYTLLVVLWFLISLSPVRSQIVVPIDELSPEDLNFSDIFKSVKIVKLETNDDCLLHGINTLKVDRDRIFTFDNRLGKVFIFDAEGKFIAQAGKKGKGPGEFVLAKDFTLDKELKRLLILDPSSYKMLVFDYDGNYIESRSSVYISDYEKINNTSFVGYSCNYPMVIGGKVVKSDLVVFDKQGALVKKYSGIRNIPRNISIETFSNLTIDSKGNVFIIPICENNLYRIDQALGLEKVCEFKFQTKIPKGIFNNLSDIRTAGGVFSAKKYPFFIKGINVTHGILSFSFKYRGKYHRCFWDIGTKNTTTVKSDDFINDLALVKSNGFRGAFEEGIIDIVPAKKYLDSYKNEMKSTGNIELVKSKYMRDELFKLTKSSSTNDNPILFFYSYKQ